MYEDSTLLALNNATRQGSKKKRDRHVFISVCCFCVCLGIPVNAGDNNAAQQEPGEESATEEGEDVIEGDSESESESQAEDETDNTNNNENNPGFFAVGYTFFVTFFTSLIPQAPRPIAQP